MGGFPKRIILFLFFRWKEYEVRMADKVGGSKREKPPITTGELMGYLNLSQSVGSSIAQEKSSSLKEFREYVDRKDPNM